MNRDRIHFTVIPLAQWRRMHPGRAAPPSPGASAPRWTRSGAGLLVPAVAALSLARGGMSRRSFFQRGGALALATSATLLMGADGGSCAGAGGVLGGLAFTAIDVLKALFPAGEDIAGGCTFTNASGKNIIVEILLDLFDVHPETGAKVPDGDGKVGTPTIPPGEHVASYAIPPESDGTKTVVGTAVNTERETVPFTVS